MTISLNEEQATSLKAAAAVAGTTQMALIRESLRRQLLEILVNQGGRGPGASYQRAVSLKESGRSLRMIAQTLSAEGYVTAQGRPWNKFSVRRLLQAPPEVTLRRPSWDSTTRNPRDPLWFLNETIRNLRLVQSLPLEIVWVGLTIVDSGRIRPLADRMWERSNQAVDLLHDLQRRLRLIRRLTKQP